MTTTYTTIQTIVMSAAEADECIRSIRLELQQAEKHYAAGQRHYTLARGYIHRLKEMHGWEALGYDTFRACIKDQFENHESTLYRQLAAAAVEQVISPNGRIGDIPERVLRPLAKKGFSEDVQRTLWEVAKTVAGSELSITSGTMNAVVETLGEALVTGTLQDADGEQHPIFEGFKADVLARMVETRKRHQQYLEPKNSTKIVSAMAVIPFEDAQGNVLLQITGAITAEQRLNVLKGGLCLKATLWVQDEGEQ